MIFRLKPLPEEAKFLCRHIIHNLFLISLSRGGIRKGKFQIAIATNNINYYFET